MGIENPSRRFTARTETLEAGRRYRLVVALKGEGPAGDQRDFVRVKTNLENDPVIRIPVNTRVREKVYTFPQSVFLGRFNVGQIKGDPEAGRAAGQMLMVYRKGIPGFKIKLSSDVPFLKFASELGPKGDQWENSVWIDPEQAKVGEIKGRSSSKPTTPRSRGWSCRSPANCYRTRLTTSVEKGRLRPPSFFEASPGSAGSHSTVCVPITFPLRVCRQRSRRRRVPAAGTPSRTGSPCAGTRSSSWKG